MEHIGGIIVKKRKFVVVVFIILTSICAVSFFGVHVNYDLTDYLPEGSRSTKALKIMEREFDQAVPNARVMLKNVTVGEALEYKKKIKNIDGISDVIWLDDVADIKKPLEMTDKGIRNKYYKNGNALISLAVEEGRELEITSKVYEVIGERNALEGNALALASVQTATVWETLKATIILLPIIILLLILTTTSWIEPILFLFAIGVSVIINMGTNLLIGEVSYITQSVTPILQLAVSLDYAIFLLHRFAEMQKQKDDPEEAMIAAMKKSFTAIAASSATTLFGFIALTFMDFEIGADLGFNLAKGIIISFVSVLVFLPALTLCSLKMIKRTKHKRILPEMSGSSRAFMKISTACLILMAIIIYPCWLAQNSNEFLYESTGVVEGQRTGEDEASVKKVFGDSTAIVVLLPKGEVGKEAELCSELEKKENVTEVVSYVSSVGSQIPDEYVSEEIVSGFYSDDNARIIVYTGTSAEGEEAFSTVDEVRKTAEKYYGANVFLCGESANLRDMKEVVTLDNKRVNIIAVLAIALVIMITFRSLLIPVLLVLSIKAAIWVNLAIPYFEGSPMNYIGYLIVNTVQLGATVDYAILLTDTYKQKRKSMYPKEAMKESLAERFRSILLSAVILSSAGFVLGAVSSNQMVAEMGILLGRGAILSLIMVVCFLPALLMILDKPLGATTYKSDFLKRRSEK